MKVRAVDAHLVKISYEVCATSAFDDPDSDNSSTSDQMLRNAERIIGLGYFCCEPS